MTDVFLVIKILVLTLLILGIAGLNTAQHYGGLTLECTNDLVTTHRQLRQFGMPFVYLERGYFSPNMCRAAGSSAPLSYEYATNEWHPLAFAADAIMGLLVLAATLWGVEMIQERFVHE